MVPVERVVDGDTFLIGPTLGAAPDGRPLSGARVRLLGVDTPEAAREGRPAECWAVEATEFTRGALDGRRARLVFDAASRVRDRFDRLLAYVEVGARDHNAALVREGHATTYRDATYAERARYLALEAEARANRRGQWGACR